MKQKADIRQEIIEVCRLMYQNKLVAATDGNVSVRLDDDRLLVTPSGVSKGLVTEDQLIVTDLEGRKIAGEGKPSSENRLHLAIYHARPDVGAVVHAHPPVTTAFTVAGKKLDQCVLPEVVFHMGCIPTSEYATPASDQGPKVIADLIGGSDAIILDRHGSVTVGGDVFSAYFKLEKLENYAQVMLAAHQLGNVQTLPPEEVEKLMETRKQLGITGKCTIKF